MDFDKDLIEIFLRKAVENLFENEPDIYEITEISIMTEWNLCHHLAIQLQQFFPEYDCDIEIIKPYYNRKRPDIILHHRGNHKNNFLVVEAKKDDEEGFEEDKDKMQKNWFKHPLSYKFGAVVNFKGLAAEIEVFENIDDESDYEGGIAQSPN